MKVRFGLVLLVVCGVGCLSGCQRSAAKADAAEVTAGQGEAEKIVHVEVTDVSDTVKVKTRTVCVRNPETGEVVKKQVPIDADSASQPKTRTVRTRDPQTGRTTTKQVPVSTATASRASDAPTTRTVRTRDPKTGRTVTKQVPIDAGAKPQPKPAASAENKFETRWEQECTVQQAFNATKQLLYDTFGLEKVYESSRREYYQPKSDTISATLKARSTINIVFDISIVLISPDSSLIVIQASSKTQPKDFVRKHGLYLQARIGEAIAAEPPAAVETIPYPKTMILDRSLDQVNQSLSDWNSKAKLTLNASNGDTYYQYKSYRTYSGIQFYFSIHMIDVNQSKLSISILDYKDKDEFPFILKGLEAALAELEKDQTAAEEGAL